MSDDLDRLLNPEGDDRPSGDVDRADAVAPVERTPVAGGRVERRLAEKAAKKRRGRSGAAAAGAAASTAASVPEDAAASVEATPTLALPSAASDTAPTALATIPGTDLERTDAAAAPPAKPRRRVTVVGVLGELLITAGVVVLMFLGWQVWINDLIVGDQQKNEAAELSQTWNKGEATVAAPVERPDPGEPIVGVEPAIGERFANLIVPRLGADYTRPIATGVSTDVLANNIGHYPGTAMPGAVGNFAVAGHRTGWGAPLADIVNLQVGDHIYIETEDGWYEYVFRSMEYVMPTGVQVLEPVPQVVGVEATDRLITITSCNPPLTAAERVIAYGVYETWYPRAGGPPAEIASLVQTAAAG